MVYEDVCEYDCILFVNIFALVNAYTLGSPPNPIIQYLIYHSLPSHISSTQKFIASLPTPPSSLHELLGPASAIGASAGAVAPTISGTTVRREPVLDHMRDLVQKCVDKGLLEFAYVHNLLWEYTQQCDNAAFRLTDLVNLLSDAPRKLVSTKPGSRTMCRVISTGGAKDRKKIMKGLKGHVLECLQHEAAHLVILRLVDVTDDTVNVQKLLLDEITATSGILKYSADGQQIGDGLPPLISVARSPFGSKLLLRLLNPVRSHLEPDEEKLFLASDIAAGTSKKSPESRRKEHLAYLRTALLTVCCRHAAVLLRCPYGSKVLVELVGVFFPVSVLGRVVSLFSGQAVEEEEDGLQQQQQQQIEGSEPESEEGSGSEGEEEEEMAGEGEGDDMEGEGSEDDDNDEEEEEEGMAKSTGNAPVIPVEVTPLPEDAIAQRTLKKLLLIQLQIETQAEGAVGQDMWETYEEDGYFPFASQLAQALVPLVEAESSVWIERNRPSFVLADVLKVPSATSVLLPVLSTAAIQKKLKSCAKETAGAKLLLDTYKEVSAAAAPARSGASRRTKK